MAPYASVTWTTGDIITETKLDNMVSNDRAEDAHESGLELLNNVALEMKEAGGTLKDMVKMNASDEMEFGNGTNILKLRNPVRARAYITAGSQSIPGGNTETVLDMDATSYDDNGDFDTANNKFVTPIAGIYVAGMSTTLDDLAAGKQWQARIAIDGTFKVLVRGDEGSADAQACFASSELKLTAGQDIDFRFLHSDTVARSVSGGEVSGFCWVRLVATD